MKIVIGIDVGGSTTKIVGYKKEDKSLLNVLRVTATDPVTSVYGALGRFVKETGIQLGDIEHIVLTGVGVSHFENDIYGIPTNRVTEFEAIGLGGKALSGKEEALVVSMGTGTAFVHAGADKIAHIGGSGVGGGTLQGLCSKIAGCTSFDNIMQLAQEGDISKVDLSVGDISKKNIGKLSADITASNFGKMEDGATNADLALGVVNMVYQTIGMLSVFACIDSNIKDVVLTGTLATAPYAKHVFGMLEKMYPVKFIIPENAVFSTAIGAALSYFI